MFKEHERSWSGRSKVRQGEEPMRSERPMGQIGKNWGGKKPT